MHWRSRVLALAVTLVLGISFFGFAQEKTLVVAIEHDIMTLDPGNHRDRETETVIRNMFDGLVTRTPDMEIVPELAVSWERPSPNEWVFHLRDGVTWHDGVPFTADDVKFTIDRTVKEGMIAGQTSPRKGLLGPVTGAEVIDRLTVKIITSTPWPALISFLPFHEMVPKHYVEEVGDEYFAEHPVGTGPFKFVRWDKGVQVVMERYEDYYGGSPDIPPVGPAKVDRVIFRIIPETSTRIAALRAGEVHIATRIPVDLIPEIEADPSLQVMAVRGTRSTFIEMNVTKPPFDNVLVRRAMNYAIDVDKIVELVLAGLATPIPSLLSPDSPFYKPLEPYGYDPERARALLAEAGYPDGFELTIDCEDYLKDVAVVVAQMLRQVGIDAKVQVWEWGVLKPKLLAHERAMWITDWGNGSLDPTGIMHPKLVTRQRGNYSGYSSCLYDGLFEFANNVTLDPESRKEAFHIAQEVIYYDAPMVFLYVAQEVYGVSRRVVNWRPSPDSRINLHDVDLMG